MAIDRPEQGTRFPAGDRWVLKCFDDDLLGFCEPPLLNFQLDAALKMKSLRRDLARVKTVLREKESV